MSFFSSGGSGHAIAWRDLSSQIGPLYIGHSERHLFRKPSKFTHFLGLAGARHTIQVDFTSRQLLLLSPGPRSSTGYGVEVLSVNDDGGQITVRVRERFPHLGDHVSAHVTYPYRLISLPAGKDVFVDWLGR